MSAQTNLHMRWAARIVAALAEAGVAHAVVSPGSRSTPLTLALADDRRVALHVVLDERSAAFVALGIARASGRPAAVVATSGTAPAHWYPAVIEASESGVPLVLLSADRPWEAQHAASPQTIDQAHLFGRYARRFVDVGAPTASDEALRALSRAVTEALSRSRSPEPGPVHLNARFRKPLEPRALACDPVGDAASIALSAPAVRLITPRASVAPSELAPVVELLASTERGLIAAGPMPLGAAACADALGALASRAGFAVYAEATSQLRRDLGEGVVTAPHLDLLLRAGALPDDALPEVIVEIGAPPVASSWSSLLDRTGAGRIVVCERGVPDPRGDARVVVQGDVAETLRALADASPARGASRFARAWRELSARARAAVEAARPTGEAEIARAAAQAAGADALFLVGNSTPVRDVDTWAPFPTPGAGVLHQRGASGIDGLVAQAVGATIGAGRPVVALLGDLTFLHDASSLASLALAAAPLTIVVVDNGGGRIFDELPIARAGRADFERLFTTPQRVDPAALAAAYGVSLTRARGGDELRAALADSRMTAPRVVWADAAPGSATAARARAVAALTAGGAR